MTKHPDPYHRWKQHLRVTNKVTKDNPHQMDLINEMYNVGTDYFSFDVIEECSSKDVGSRERYWIDYLDTHKNGYNMVTPGEKKEELKKRIVSQKTLTRLKIRQANRLAKSNY